MLFGINDELKAPKLLLCQPNETIVENVVYFARDLDFDILYNGINTFTFKFIEGLSEEEKNEYYDLMQFPNYIKIENYDDLINGEYVVVGRSFKNDNDGKGEYQEIQCASSEVNLQTRKLTEEIDGTYYLYNTVEPKDTILDIIIRKLPNWELGHVDTTLMIKKRTFNIKDIDIYSFLYNDVSEAYECIFLFDTINKLINVYDVNNDIKMSNLKFTTKNLIKSLDIKEETDQLITSLYVKGGDGVYINDVNLAGGSQIYNFDYYREKKLMSQPLLDALDSYDIKVANNTVRYSNLITEIKNKSNEILDLQAHTPEYEIIVTNQATNNTTIISPALSSESGLSQLNSLLTQLTTATNNRVKLGFQNTSDIGNEIVKVEKMIVDKENAIKSAQDIINANRTEMANIRVSLNFENNFSKALLKELDRFVKEDTLQSNDFIYTDIMSTEEKLQVSQDLLEFAQDSLRRMSTPRYTFSINSINVLASKELQELAEQLILGDSFLIELSKDKTFLATLMQIKLKFGLDNVTNFEVGFGNRNKLDTSMTLFNSFRTAVNMGTNYSYDLLKMENTAKKADESYQYVNNSLTATGIDFLKTTNEETYFGETGIASKDKNSGREVRINSSTIMFSEDNFKTFAKAALGRIKLPDGTWGYGLIAANIIGEMIIGNSLIIKNKNQTFKVDADGVTIENGKFTMQNANGKNKITLNATTGLEAYYNSEKMLGYNINTGAFVLEKGSINSPKITGAEIIASTFENKDKSFRVDANGVVYATNIIISDRSQVNGGTLVDGTVTNGKIKDLSADKINAGTINADRIGAKSINADKLTVEKLSAISATLGDVTTGSLVAGAVGAIYIEGAEIKGGKIRGGRYYNTVGDANLFIGDSAFGDFRFYNKNNNSVFEIYDNLDSIDLMSYNQTFLRSGSFGSYPQGTWDFSYANVSGISVDVNAYDVSYKDTTVGAKLVDINLAIESLQNRVTALENKIK